MQYYPNPFNPETEIGFSIPQQTNVSIKIYNSQGEESAAILNEVRSRGYHAVNWNASDFPSGIYYYQLITEKITITKKMVLIK